MKFDTTRNEYRFRVRKPTVCQRDTFRSIDFSYERGIRAVICRPHGSATTKVQSVAFRRDKWTPQTATDWMSRHKFSGLSGLFPKPQAVRLVDVFALGPFMVWAGIKLRADHPTAGAVMVLAGAGTVLYNGYNYLETT